MTLHTRILTKTPGLNPESAFDRLAHLIGAKEGEYTVGENSIHMRAMQGFPALIWVNHWNGELSPAHKHDTFCYVWDDDSNPTDELGCSGDFYSQGYVELNFDTAYGYRADSNGASCGDLHAWLVKELGQWLDALGVEWVWHDESGDGWQPSAMIHKGDYGTLGNPNVGQIGSAVPPQDRSAHRDFLAVAMAAIASKGEQP